MTSSLMDIRSLLLRYLSSKLPDAELAAFEQRLLTDHAFSDEVAACEQDLIDDYARNRLSPQERSELEPWVNATPGRRHRVATARALLAALASRSGQAEIRQNQAVQPRTRASQLYWPMALAASAVVAFVLFGVYVRRAASHRAPQQASLSAPASIPAAKEPARIKADVILLAAERVRGLQNVLIYPLHRQAPIILEVILPGKAALAGYSLRVTPQAGTSPVAALTGIGAQKLGTGVYLKLQMPAGSLPPGRYTVAIDGHGQSVTTSFEVAWAK